MGIFDKFKQIFKPKDNNQISKHKKSNEKVEKEDELNKESSSKNNSSSIR